MIDGNCKSKGTGSKNNDGEKFKSLYIMSIDEKDCAVGFINKKVE